MDKEREKFLNSLGTPMGSKMAQPITFNQKKIENEGKNSAAMKKLYIVSFVSIFFIAA
jgi:hypothetical protein